MPELAAIVARLEPELGPLDGEPQPLDGGITNRNFRAALRRRAIYVLRLCGKDTALLGIDRSTEEIAATPRGGRGIAPAGRGLPAATCPPRHPLRARAAI